MTTLFHNKSVKFKCPKCGYEMSQTIGWLETNNRITCAGCGVGIRLDTGDLIRGAEKAQEAIDGLPKSIKVKF